MCSKGAVSAPATDELTFTRDEIVRLLVRLGAALIVLLGIVATFSHFFRQELEGLGQTFVLRFGYVGMMLGTFLSDGFHLPIPPQLYMLLAISSRSPFLLSFAAITAGSLLGSVFAYRLAHAVAHVSWFSHRLERPRRLAERALLRLGDKGALFASLLPVPYGTLLYLTGLSRLPTRFFVLLCLWRIPRLAAYYALIYFGWSSVAP